MYAPQGVRKTPSVKAQSGGWVSPCSCPPVCTSSIHHQPHPAKENESQEMPTRGLTTGYGAVCLWDASLRNIRFASPLSSFDVKPSRRRERLGNWG